MVFKAFNGCRSKNGVQKVKFLKNIFQANMRFVVLKLVLPNKFS